jgi:hypothetical protein
MFHDRKNITCLATIAACIVLIAALANPAEAARARRAAKAQPEMLPAPGASYAPGPVEYGPVGGPCAPCVIYANKPCCDPCIPLVPQVLTVCDPCTGCPVPVEVCLPACCDGEPCVSSRNTLFGNGLVRFDWCGGYGVTVRFTRCGDLKVIYH